MLRISRINFKMFPIMASTYNGVVHYSTNENSIIGRVSFDEVRVSPFYIDKSLFVEAVLDSRTNHMLITAPRRFNKSSNIRMLQSFLESDQYKAVFQDLKIGKTPVMDLIGQYPVVFVNLKEGCSAIRSFDRVVESVRISLHLAFRRHPYLKNSSKLSELDKKLYDLWTNPFTVHRLDSDFVQVGLLELCRLIFTHYERKCFLIVDEFDAISNNAASNAEETFTDIVDFYCAVIGHVVKENDIYVYKSVLTGINKIMSPGASSSLSPVIHFPFMENETFIDFYGILDSEFDDLMLRPCNSTLRSMAPQAKEQYNGYLVFDRKIMNTLNVVNFCELKRVVSYWASSGVPLLSLERTCEKEAVHHCFQRLICDEKIEIERASFSTKTFKSFVDKFYDPHKEIKNIDPLLYYYLQEGYLSGSKCTEDLISVYIPNKELKDVFCTAVEIFFTEKYGIETEDVQKCIQVLKVFKVEDDRSCREAVSVMCSTVKTICANPVYKTLLNEYTLQDIVFSLLFIGGFRPVSERRVNQKGYKYRRFDICAIRNGQGILLELKLNPKTPVEGVTQVFEKDYTQGLIDLSTSTGTLLEEVLIIGFNVTTLGDDGYDVSAYYCRSTTNFEEMTVV